MNKLQIESYFHCALCIDEYQSSPHLRSTMAPKDYQRIQAGFTQAGIQVWCVRHDCNMLHIDFEGVKHPADTTRQGDDIDAEDPPVLSIVK